MNQLSGSDIGFHSGEITMSLPEGFIFVFGGNLAGRHGKGAALTAKNKFGAIYGQGIGFQGSSYSIPTKGYKLEVLDPFIIDSYVQDFRQFVNNRKEFTFFVTALGTGLARLEDETIAPMFAGIPRCYFPNNWKPFLEV